MHKAQWGTMVTKKPRPSLALCRLQKLSRDCRHDRKGKHLAGRERHCVSEERAPGRWWRIWEALGKVRLD